MNYFLTHSRIFFIVYSIIFFQPSFSASLSSAYTIQQIGLTSLEYVREDGFRRSDLRQYNSNGQAVGDSYRFSGSSGLGQNSWFFNGSSTIQIGLTGNSFTRDDGSIFNRVIALSESGHAIGNTTRYTGSEYMGSSVWVYDGISTHELGLTGAEYVRQDGFKFSNFQTSGRSINNVGQVVGTSNRYGGMNNLGLSAWVYSQGNTQRLGFWDTAHTRNDGEQRSIATAINNQGVVVGNSTRYQGNVTVGGTAWLYDGVTTHEIGLTTGEYISDDGYRSSTVASFRSLSQSGKVAGYSSRYNGNTSIGRSAFLYDGAVTHEIGLTSDEHTRDDGYRYSFVGRINESGQVIGRSDRFLGSIRNGNSAWFYDGSATHEIGLIGTEYTRQDGFRSSQANFLNEAGQITGSTTRFSGSTSLGNTAWLYDNGSYTQVGLVDTQHMSTSGYRYSGIFNLNESGHVLGISQQYDNGTVHRGNSAFLYDGVSSRSIGIRNTDFAFVDGYSYGDEFQFHLNESGMVAGTTIIAFGERYDDRNLSGVVGWVYDITLDETIAFDFSLDSNGNPFSIVNYLGKDGLVLGTYTDFSDNSSHAFAYTTETGTIDLGLLVYGGIDAVGWETIAGLTGSDNLGNIFGRGVLNDGLNSNMAFVLTPTSIPIPPALLLFSSALIGLVSLKRKS